MRGTVILILVLALSALWLQAQVGIPGREGLASSQIYPPVIRGCLERSGFYYTVVGKDGTAYDLTGNTTHLSHYVGHEVEISGEPTVVSVSTTMIHAASTVEEYPALELKTVKNYRAHATQPSRKGCGAKAHPGSAPQKKARSRGSLRRYGTRVGNVALEIIAFSAD